jgi:hypothetical protein
MMKLNARGFEERAEKQSWGIYKWKCAWSVPKESQRCLTRLYRPLSGVDDGIIRSPTRRKRILCLIENIVLGTVAVGYYYPKSMHGADFFPIMTYYDLAPKTTSS